MKRLKVYQFVLVLLLFSGPILAEERKETTTLLIWGDSLSSAYGMAVEQGWVSLLQQKLGSNYRIINASVSGETSGGGKSRLSAALLNHKPDVIVLELGGNDGLRGIPPAATKKNLEAMIEMARKSSAKVLLLGIKIPPNYGINYIRRFESIYPELAQKHRVELAPFMLKGIAEDFSLMQNDGIHPTAKAQPIIVKNVLPALQRLLSK